MHHKKISLTSTDNQNASSNRCEFKTTACQITVIRSDFT